MAALSSRAPAPTGRSSSGTCVRSAANSPLWHSTGERSECWADEEWVLTGPNRAHVHRVFCGAERGGGRVLSAPCKGGPERGNTGSVPRRRPDEGDPPGPPLCRDRL